MDNLKAYKRYLLKCGYSSDNIDSNFIRAANVKRSKTLKSNKKVQKQNEKRVHYFSTSYDPEFPNTRECIKKHEKILEEDPEMKRLFPKGCFRVTERRGHKNLKEHLAPSRFKWEGCSREEPEQDSLDGGIGEAGCWKCGECGTSVQGRKRANNLVNCNVIKEAKTFRSNSTKEWYKIRQHINCSSKNVIYLVTCLKCGIQAVGKATHFGKRISNYITHIGKKRDTCCTNKHFYGTPGHSIEDFSITGIARLENPPTDPEELKLRLWEFEGYWQIKLNTLEPHGLNSANEYENAQRMIRAKKIGKRSYSV